MTSVRPLSWENFRSTILIHGEQRVHRLLEEPCIEIFGDGVNNRIGILLSLGRETRIPPELSRLTQITSRVVMIGGTKLLELATVAKPIYRTFYHFAVAVAERAEAGGMEPVDAAKLELACFAELAAAHSSFGIERQVGLLGELLFLERLLGAIGIDAVEAWLGPSGETHDFRFGRKEFEIKTTVASRRSHTINGIEQMTPSQGCTLSIVSVLLGPPGPVGGFSLSSKIGELARRFPEGSSQSKRFLGGLEKAGVPQSLLEDYPRRFALRRPIGLVPVDEKCPAITRRAIQAALGPLASRVGSLWYDVDLEGLETLEGTPEFDEAISA